MSREKRLSVTPGCHACGMSEHDEPLVERMDPDGDLRTMAKGGLTISQVASAFGFQKKLPHQARKLDRQMRTLFSSAEEAFRVLSPLRWPLIENSNLEVNYLLNRSHVLEHAGNLAGFRFRVRYRFKSFSSAAAVITQATASSPHAFLRRSVSSTAILRFISTAMP